MRISRYHCFIGLLIFSLILVTGACQSTPRVVNIDATGWPFCSRKAYIEGNHIPENYRALALSPDGTHIAGSSNSTGLGMYTYKVDPSRRYQPVEQIWGHAASEAFSNISTMAWSPMGEILAAGSQAGAVAVLDAETGELFHTFEEGSNSEQVDNIAWSPDGTHLAASIDSYIHVWDTATYQQLYLLAGSGKLAWSPDGVHLASGNPKEITQVIVWDLQTNTPIHILQGHGSAVTSMAWSPGGDQLAIGTKQRKLFIRDAKTGETLRQFKNMLNPITEIAWSPDGKKLAATAGGANGYNVFIWNLKTNAPLCMTQRSPQILSMAWSLDSTQLLAGQGSYIVEIWNIQP